MTISELIDEGVTILTDAGITDARMDAGLLFEYLFKVDRYVISAHPEKEMSEDDHISYVNLIKERAKRIPLQHLTGMTGFMGLEFYVNQNVLIPRADTENLVETVLPYIHDGMSILDLCTGSGCIIISLLAYSNDTRGVGTDISKKALEVAVKNADFNKDRLEGRFLEFYQGDLYEALKNTGSESGIESSTENGTENGAENYKYDIIVSNPPYIKTKDIEELEAEVKDHDPFIALDGGEDGLTFYRRILEGINGHLKKGGRLFVEIGYDQGEKVSSLFKEAGLIEVEVHKDYSKNDRVVSGTRPLL